MFNSKVGYALRIVFNALRVNQVPKKVRDAYPTWLQV